MLPGTLQLIRPLSLRLSLLMNSLLATRIVQELIIDSQQHEIVGLSQFVDFIEVHEIVWLLRA
jgi:hypothetical protein